MKLIESTAKIIDIADTPNQVASKQGFGTGAHRQRAFPTGADLIAKLEKYCDYIKSTGYAEYPTKMGFADYCGVDRSTTWHAVNRFYPEIRKQWQETIEQTLINGVNAGVYQQTMTIFILKNWCDWTDKRETIATEKKPAIASKQQLREALQAYISAPEQEQQEQE